MSALSALRHEAELDAVLSVEASIEDVIELRRPTRMLAATFTVWRLLDGGKAQPHHVGGESLIEIEREIADAVYYGDTFLVQETGTITGKAMLHSYQVRRGKAVAWDANARRVYSHVADRLLSVEVAAFLPVEPWRHVPGCDVLGADPHTITFAKLDRERARG